MSNCMMVAMIAEREMVGLAGLGPGDEAEAGAGAGAMVGATG